MSRASANPIIFPGGSPREGDLRGAPPPNRRIRKKRNVPVIEAPDERILDPMMPANDADVLEFLEAAGKSRSSWKHALRMTALGVMAVTITFFVVFGLIRYTRTSPRFSIRAIELRGNARRSPDDVMKRAGVTMGQNIFTADLETMRSAILEDPWIETASLSRRLPSTIGMDITEREAAAVVAVGPDVYLATRQGELFKTVEPGDPVDYPVVTGLRVEDLAEERAAGARATRVSSVARALDVAAEYDRTSLAKSLPVQEVHVDDDGSLTLSVGSDPIELRLGRGSFRRRFDQASRVLQELRNRGKSADVVFLDNEAHPERVVVRTR
ncbi:MAG TPA: FtsQ-type POTRA domain-containing protein [Polyangiaceae bacterium]|jgi:cell division protein FtsQ